MDNFSKMTDDVLVAKYVGGCNEAFDELLLRYKDRLYNYISYQLSQQADLVDDIFQETFVKAIMTLKSCRYTEGGYFLSWLTRIAHNLIIDNYRQDAHMHVVSHDDDNIDLLNNADLVDSYHEAELINEQTLRDVKRLMNNLPDNQREVVYMRYYENKSFKEIADETGVSINTSLGRMRYAIMNMRRMAEEYDISLEML